jgi:CHRD domain
MKHLPSTLLAIAVGGITAYSAFTNVACDDGDDDTIPVTTGIGGHGGGATPGIGGSTGSASILTYSVTLNGAGVVPSRPSAAIGNATLTIAPGTGSVTVSGSYTGLTSMVTGAGIHGPAPTTATAPVIVPLNVSGGTSGTITGGGTLDPTQVTDLKAGQTYIEIQTSTYPDGEIRAQIAIDNAIGAKP